MKIAINGFGRIGRAITKLNSNYSVFDINLINDINPSASNLSYLLKYDSTYGIFEKNILLKNNNFLIDNKKIKISSFKKIDQLELKKNNIDILIDSTGINHSRSDLEKIIKKENLKFIILTNSSDMSDIEVVMGLNETKIKKKNKIISASICDANAVAHLIKWIDDEYSIINGSLTTLHPWLSYQNLSDGTSISQSNPSVPWNDFALGRSAVNNLIPKNTSAINATAKIIPSIDKKFISFSYRTPMDIVTSADLLINVKKNLNLNKLKLYLEKKVKNSKFVSINTESLVSRDFIKNESSCIIDLNWLKVNLNTIKLIAWYDNEWAYSKRILDLVSYLKKI